MHVWKRVVTFLLLSLLYFYFVPYLPKAQAAGNYTLTVMHVNDSHSHLKQYPKLTTAVKEVRASYPNALLLHAGDVFYGTSYFTNFHGQASIWFMNNLKYDAMTLGNHEFDEGTTVLADFIKGLSFPVISANINPYLDPALGPLSINSISSSPAGGKIYPAIVKEVNGEKIGIFGLLTTESRYIFPVPVNDQITTSKATVDALKQQGVNKIIALSHLGESVDENLAKNVDGIDIIVGGHTHTVLGQPVIIQKTEPTVIVQAGDWLDYLGLLNVTFDANGVVIAQNGKLLSVSSYAADSEAQAVLNQIDAGILPGSDPQPEPVKNGWIVNGGNTYYYVNGVMQTEWQTISGNTYYFGSDGVMRKGWQTINGNTYYFGSETGIMKTGWYTIGGVLYHFGDNGILIPPDAEKNGFIVDGGNTYYYINGVMQKGWQTINGNTYYFGSSSGVMKTGWYTIDGVLYHFGDDGILIPPDAEKNGFIVDGGNTYYYVNGVMQKGWQTINGYQYYFGSVTGTMKTGYYTIDGVTYHFDIDGKLIS